MSNQDLYKVAERAIDDLFGDTSVSAEKALDNMQELKANIDTKIDCLETDLENQNQ